MWKRLRDARAKAFRLAQDRTRSLGRAIAPGKKRNVLFLHNSYYHFYYLAQALRRRGWDAIVVSLENSNGPNAGYYHGEDVNLFAEDVATFTRNIEVFYRDAIERFTLLHFANDGVMSFFPANWASDEPWDILEWRRRGHKIAYTVSGCSSAVAQSTVARWSATGGAVVCDRCPWQQRPDVCSDTKNLAWGRKVQRYCDLIFTETTPALDYAAGPRAIREPTTMCLDPTFWRPDLKIPKRLQIARKSGELLVYHSFGNYELRSQKGRNIKGTPAVIAAVEQLQREGIQVRLVFVTDVKNIEARFLQVQADVVVDQLNYGRYGATAREAMMLGKPTICYLNRNELTSTDQLRSLAEVPLVSATEATISSVLRELLLDPERRAELGRAGRQYALTWHSADACAKRYERIYDRFMAGEVTGYPFPPSVQDEPVRPQYPSP